MDTNNEIRSASSPDPKLHRRQALICPLGEGKAEEPCRKGIQVDKGTKNRLRGKQ